MNRNETHYLENCISQKHQRWLLSEISDVQTKNTGQIAIPNQPISEYKINKLNPAVTWLEKVLITNNVGAIAPDFNEKSNIKLETGSCYFPQVGTMSRTDADLYGIVPLSKEITIHLFDEWVDVFDRSVSQRPQHMELLAKKDSAEHTTNFPLSPYTEQDQQILKKVSWSMKKTVQPGSAFFWNCSRLYCSETSKSTLDCLSVLTYF
jgi:hypothetical protein